jgi:hypothetical protein
LGFSTVVARAWRLYRQRFAPLAWLFAVVAAIITLIPNLLLFDIADGALLPLYLLVQVILPAVIASYAFGIAAHILARHLQHADLGPREAINRLGPSAKDMIAAALFAGMISLVLVLFLSGVGLLLFSVFFGPPVIIQLISVEELNLSNAWQRARVLLSGNWGRALLVITTVAIAINLLGAVLLGTISELLTGAPDLVRYLVLSGVQIVIVAVTLPYLATTGFVIYNELNSFEAEPSAA